MKLELKHTDGEVITLFNQGDMFAPTEQEFERAFELFEHCVDLAVNVMHLTGKILTVDLNGHEIPGTISIVQELQEWYMMEVQ